jgi:hypothetical protein
MRDFNGDHRINDRDSAGTGTNGAPCMRAYAMLVPAVQAQGFCLLVLFDPHKHDASDWRGHNEDETSIMHGQCKVTGDR